MKGRRNLFLQNGPKLQIAGIIIFVIERENFQECNFRKKKIYGMILYLPIKISAGARTGG